MRIVGIFLWIIFGGVVLWFFTLNLDQTVDIDLFNKTYSDVNLVSVIFISIFFGVALGSLLLLSQFFKTRSRLVQLRKEYEQLRKESEIMQKVSSPKPAAEKVVKEPEDKEKEIQSESDE